MGRRSVLGLAGATLAAPSSLFAQQARRIFRVSFPAIAPRHTLDRFVMAFEDGLRDHGYVPGKDVVLEVRSAEGKLGTYPQVVKEVVESRPDVILTGVNANTTAVKAATQTIPIVMVVGRDVIRQGYVESFARPGGNVTGLTWDVGDAVTIKRLELLKEAAPKISRVAVMFDPPYEVRDGPAIRAGASALNLSVVWHDATDDFERSFAAAARDGAHALFVSGGPRMFARHAEVVSQAARHRLPATYTEIRFVEAGGLMSYAPDIAALFRASARYVDRILKGAKPADLPVEQPSKIDLTINLKTAKALGLTLPGCCTFYPCDRGGRHHILLASWTRLLPLNGAPSV